MYSKTIEEKLKDLPLSSGVYIMYGSDGTVLYVGKAKVLKNRVKQYFFNSSNRNEKVSALMSRVTDFRYIITPSEADAFVLENNLIKQHMPPYNILLKDDKYYPYVRIDVKSDFPRLIITRRMLNDKAKYFGPIMGDSKQLLEVLMDMYPTVSCNHNLSKLPQGFRACFNHHLGKCPAPCVGNISKEDYAEIISNVIKFFAGDFRPLRELVTSKMMLASEQENFEKAMTHKAQLSLIDRLKETKIADVSKLVDWDIFAIACNGQQCAVNLQMVRKGRVIYAYNFPATDAGLEYAQTLSSFVSSYYNNTNSFPKEILINAEDDEMAGLEEAISERAKRKVKIVCPKSGDKRKLVQMAEANAADYLQKAQAKADRKFSMTTGAVDQLQNLLSLPSKPQRIECYDISNISGVDKVASMVVFTGGEPDNGCYRRFKINTVEGANDFACMKEVLERRIAKLGDELFGKTPDLVVIDGGKGQLSSAVSAFEEAGVSGISIISLAKKQEEVFLPNKSQPVILPRGSFALNLLINIRDEAHRFAITYYRSLHSKNSLKSMLNEIDGVGKKRQVALIKKFGTISRIANATAEQLCETEGINAKIAENILSKLKNMS